MIGIFGALLGTAAFTYALVSVSIPTPEDASRMTLVAEAYFVLVTVCIALVLLDARRFVVRRSEVIREKGVSPLSPGWIIPYVLSDRRYLKLFIVSTLIYGVFYAVITSMIVYQPSIDFIQAYGARIPSLLVTPLRAAPFLSPVVTAYLVNHVGLLLTPMTVIFLVATSVLVGLNFALAGFAFDSRARGAGRGWLGGIGAVVGLFTGCPTCAGLFFASFLGGAGGVTAATLLGFYQPVFVLFSIPVLIAAPYLTSRSLSKVFREGCVFLQRPA